MPQLCPVFDDVTETNVYHNPPVLTKKPETEAFDEGSVEKIEEKSEENGETAAAEESNNVEKPEENFRSSCEEMTEDNDISENVRTLVLLYECNLVSLLTLLSLSVRFEVFLEKGAVGWGT